MNSLGLGITLVQFIETLPEFVEPVIKLFASIPILRAKGQYAYIKCKSSDN
jgi:hypothetical protein